LSLCAYQPSKSSPRVFPVAHCYVALSASEMLTFLDPLLTTPH
jgi:hypothetical protein